MRPESEFQGGKISQTRVLSVNLARFHHCMCMGPGLHRKRTLARGHGRTAPQTGPEERGAPPHKSDGVRLPGQACLYQMTFVAS
ncbi:hypothetical protein QQF64_013801 [Cirrhinus molitorella]|uniref:Uncharacterized protein n=1 Tax=Cirrhinus molitorella TaxID=172907 RepID=A0ABR3LS92_9TELE